MSALDARNCMHLRRASASSSRLSLRKARYNERRQSIRSLHVSADGQRSLLNTPVDSDPSPPGARIG
jgi:hypothetical protein